MNENHLKLYDKNIVNDDKANRLVAPNQFHNVLTIQKKNIEECLEIYWMMWIFAFNTLCAYYGDRLVWVVKIICLVVGIYVELE